MKGRPSIHQDKDVIRKAQELFWEKGFNATSLSELSKATGAGAGSLYNTFKGGKKELFKKSLQQRREDLKEFSLQLENSDNPLELIKNHFRTIVNADHRSHLRGCIVANTIIEMTFIDDELENEAIEILKETEKLYTATILEEQKKGNIKSKIPATTLGKYLISLWCGINSLRRIYPDQEILEQQIELQLQIIN
ncbi:TetR/AcrR family transcriptional regulator [Maribacter sp. PR1]|uniref:TetR/AcrR family transcriptional regulator n=1 Tax=Maribacter cobaltidurans TaxID=1178778 RepID=A0ABU7IYD4_9FLAO|nr:MULTISPECIES: TetR/AcrR family transcriptional regulator [Maribacter]MDC6390599.1 TetR/AcrR family transcriptional regulator [Maribacter sp. PR1]MEE1977990.1 TetR/AcrR family transcriptional regulator [Maribacter cobaltidurans]